MNHLNPGLLGAYNSLTDKHLTGYFNNTRIRRHLQKVGLLSRSGRIIPEKEYRHKLIQRAHQRHIRECLAQAIFHKVLDMERLHQIEIKRRLEDFARRERVHKIKVERSNRYEEDHIMMLSPRPPTGPKTRHSGPEGDHSESTESPGSSRPNTAPGKMQRPVRLKPLNSTGTPGSRKRNSSRYRNQESSNETDHPFSSPLERDAPRHLTLTDFSSSVSPYRLPVINNFVTPVPPLTKRKEKGPKGNGTLWGRRLRPTTAPSAADTQEGTVQRASAQSTVLVKMIYFGKSVHLSHDLMDLKDEVKVFQQHCGGENLCVYKGRVKELETFQFVSRRHRGFPFSLTFFLNGLQVERLSSCCEFKHRKGSRLGGRHGHFGFTGVEGASPCYRCIIAMGLDKKPTPPKRAKEDPLLSTSRENSKEEEEEPDSVQALKTDSDVKAENKPKNEYEEDFEADDEGPVEDHETTPSPTREEDKKSGKNDENDNEVPEKTRDSDSEAEDSVKKVKKKLPSSSSGLSSSSPCSDEDKESEEGPDPGNAEDIPGEQVEPERHDSTFASEKDTKLEETEAVDSGSVSLPQQTEDEWLTQDSTVEKSEVEVSEETEREGGEGEKLGEEEEEEAAEKHVLKDEEEKKEVEPERAKSVQEKLAEAILNVAECSSEAEFSDTTTEEDEVASVRTQQQSPGAEPETNKQEEVFKESAVEHLEPASKANTVDGDAADTEQHTEELENKTQETPQPESKEDTSEDLTSKQEEEMDEQKDKKNDETTLEDHPQEEISEEVAVNESNLEISETEKDSDTAPAEKDDKEQEEIKEEGAEDDNQASQEPELTGTFDNEKTAEAEESNAEYSKAEDSFTQEPEKEDETGDTPVEETELAQTLEELEEPKEVIEDPQPENPGETALVDTEGTGHNSANQDAEAVSQKQTENDTVNAENGEEEVFQDEASAKDRVEEGDRADGEIEGAVKEDEEKNDENIDDVKASENNLEVGTENKSEEQEVEDKVEKAEADTANTDEQKETESTLEQDAEAVDEGKADKDGPDTDNEKNEEGSKDNRSLQEEETGEGENKTEQDIEVMVDDGQGEIESAMEKDNEAEDESKSDTLNKPDEQVKEDESVKEEETDGENHGEVVADEVQNSTENNIHDEAEVNAKETIEASQDEAEEEKTEEDAGGGDVVEVEEGLEEANVEATAADQDPQTEEVGGEGVVQIENMEEGKEDAEVVKEEITEDTANQENAETVENIETENKPEESEVESKEEEPEEDVRVTELSVDKDAELGSESKSGEDMENNQLKEEVKDTESIKEKDETEEESKPEDNSVVGEDLNGKNEGEQNTELNIEDDAMKQEEDNNDQTEDGPQEATVGSDEQEGEEERIGTAEGNSEKEEDPPAKLEEDEAAVEEAKDLIDHADTEQGTTNEEGLKDEQEDQGEKAPSIPPEARSNNADPEAEVQVDAKTTVEESGETEESEMKGTDTDLPDKAKEDKENGTAENGKSADEEDSTSSASPSEESQPVEKVTALRREDKESTISEDAELLATPPVDQGDLVSNWVNIHQASRYFETFVEPLDDIKSLISQEGDRKVNGEPVEEVEGTVLSTKVSESGEGEGDKTSENAKDEQDGIPLKSDLEDFEDTLVESFKVETKPDAESDTRSNHSKDTTARSAKNVSEGRVDTEAEDTVANSESVFTAGEQQAVTLDNVVNLSETPVMKFEISQDS
ncbi:glutamate-rich protein 3 isoform X2 [Astyanax mexicanus]|uniref:glutamate-rich protein 3 isoform X2 n=1 Tax=Astyanax mexicanus TaxID=7994 RepID=UPI0020CAADAC|nr:glutamate-rich protein 3 isoform X2 [Astyanax mexicanus]